MNGEGFIYSNGIINFNGITLQNFPIVAPIGESVPGTASYATSDDFSNSADIANWQLDNFGGSSNSYVYNTWLQMTIANANYRGITKAAGAGNWDIRVKFVGQRDFSENTDCGILAYSNAGTGFCYSWGDTAAGYSVVALKQLSTFNYNGDYAAVGVHAGFVTCYLRMVYDQAANRCACYFAPDGNNWSRHVFNITPPAGITRIGVGGRGSGAVPITMFVDWVRFF